MRHAHTPTRALSRVVLPLQLNFNLVPDRLNLLPFPLCAPNQIANEKPFEDWNQRHRENKKDGTERSEVEQEAEDRVNAAEGLL